jgi:hypothetical protein
MTDAQIVAIAITVLAVLGGTLFNNVRISDLAGRFADTNTRLSDAKDLLRAEFHREFAEHKLQLVENNVQINKRFDSLDRKLDEMLRMVGDHETRIGRLEERPR